MEDKVHFRADHFKIGSWYAVDEYLGGPTTTPWGQEIIPDPDFDGTPIKVLAISMPFLCVTNGSDTISIDTRDWGLVELGKKYVKEMLPEKRVKSSQRRKIETPGQRKRRKRRKHDLRDCPRCGERRRQRRVGEGIWQMVCPNCGWNGQLGDGVPE